MNTKAKQINVEDLNKHVRLQLKFISKIKFRIYLLIIYNTLILVFFIFFYLKKQMEFQTIVNMDSLFY